jgi:membrane protein DedA with SNARE-associated domain
VQTIQSWLAYVPPGLIYILVAVVIGIESLGIPLPGEIVLVSAALFATGGHTNIWWVAIAGSLGAIFGDSIGYAIGRRGGRGFLDWLGRRFPKHMGPSQLHRVERAFHRWGVMAIFFGRFVALLRVLAGPVSGALRIPYPRFLLANVVGGILWAAGTAFAVFALGRVAEQWLSRFSWIALVAAIGGGFVTTMLLRRRARVVMDADSDSDASVV